jgi:hypothetical protein
MQRPGLLEQTKQTTPSGRRAGGKVVHGRLDDHRAWASVLTAEFGVPSSVGAGHNPRGKDGKDQRSLGFAQMFARRQIPLNQAS